MRFVSLFSFCLCLCLLPLQALALTDQEHAAYLRGSPAYAKAEKRMNAAWKALRNALSKEQFRVLLGEQRLWLRDARDAEAKALAASTPSPAEAYAAVTLKRAEALEAKIRRPVPAAVTGSPAPGAAKKSAPPQKAPELTPSSPPRGKTAKAERPAGDRNHRGPGGDNKSRSPVGDGKSRNLVGDGKSRNLVGSYGSGPNLVEVMASDDGYYVAVSATAPDARWLCSMEGTGKLEGAVLRITSASSGKAVVVPIQVREDALVIPPTQGAACGAGGSVEGVYVKKRQ